MAVAVWHSTSREEVAQLMLGEVIEDIRIRIRTVYTDPY